MFLVHDRYLGESFLYVTYAVFSVLLLVRFRGALRRFGGDSFVLAVILLGSSVLIDAFQGVFPASYETVPLFEEGAKCVGIAVRLAFWCHDVNAASRVSPS